MDAAIKMKRGRGQNYMMRSEKRPGFGSTPPQEPKKSIWYQVLTVILLIVFCPVGLILLWRKRLKWPGFVKFIAMLLSLLMFFVEMGAALWYPFEDERIRDIQQKASVAIEQAVDVTAEWITEKSEQASANWNAFWENKREIGAAVGNHALGLLQDAIATPSPEPTQVPPMTLTQSGSHTEAAELIGEATTEPTAEPTAEPTTEPTAEPTAEATAAPTAEPTAEPTGEPTAEPTAEPTEEPTEVPDLSANVLERPTPSASVNPTLHPGASRTPVPPVTPTPSPAPTAIPTFTPTPAPTPAQAVQITVNPADIPDLQSAGEATVWYTSNGKYYHKGPSCGSMSNAAKHSLKSAVSAGKKACPYCHPVEESWAKEKRPTVFVASDNYWHVRVGCESNTDSCTPMLLDDVRGSYRYAPCDACGSRYYVNGVPSAAPEATKASEAGATAAPATAEPVPEIKTAGEVMVWHTSNGKWYHKASKCGSMSNASQHTLASAASKGKTACPYCHPIDESWAEINEDVVFVSGSGTWHIDEACRANTGEYTVMTLTAARKDGELSPCRTCGAQHYVDGRPQPTASAQTATAAPETDGPVVEDGLNLNSVVNGDVLVYYSGNTSHYHRRDRCASSTTTVFQPHTLMEALLEGKISCPLCNPPAPETK